ncbi:MAG: transposase family protein [Acidimicrobiales bacterium]
MVVTGWELTDSAGNGTRPKVEVRVRLEAGRRGRCGRCGTVSPWFDRGDGERPWRHVDVGYATCELVVDAPRVSCADHCVTVAQGRDPREDQLSPLSKVESLRGSQGGSDVDHGRQVAHA